MLSISTIGEYHIILTKVEIWERKLLHCDRTEQQTRAVRQCEIANNFKVTLTHPDHKSEKLKMDQFGE